MTVPIVPASPVNPVITIQPVTTIPTRDDGGGGANPLASLATGTLVEGFVVNRDALSNPILRTPLGDLRITSDVFLKTGSEVVFRVDASQSSLARIVTVDGLTPQDYSIQSARGLTRDTITPSGLETLGSAAATTAAGAPLATTASQAKAVLQAIILQVQGESDLPAPSTPSTPTLAARAFSLAQSAPLPIVSQLASLRSGSPLRLTLVDVKLPPTPIALANLPTSSNLAALLAPPSASSPSTLPADRATNSPALPTNPPGQPAGQAITAVTAQPIAPQPAAIARTAPQIAPTNAASAPAPVAQGISPSSAAATYAATTAAPAATALPNVVSRHAAPIASAPASSQTLQPTGPHQLVASVIGHDADGANIVHTAVATLKIYTPQPLPTGTDLLLQAAPPAAQDAVTTAPLPASPVIPGYAPTAPLSQQLGAFAQLLSWLNANQPDVAQTVTAHLPTLGPQFTNGLLHFLVGIRSGDASEVISKRALQLLEVNNPDLLARVRQQVEQLQTGFLTPPTNGWSLLPVPLFFTGELQPAKLYIHRDAPDEGTAGQSAGRGQRFILEIETSQLGALQFDGFVRSHERSKSFDLMVRSSIGLPEEVSRGIRDIFDHSLASAQLKGQIIFQSGSQHFVKPAVPNTAFSGLGPNTILA